MYTLFEFTLYVKEFGDGSKLSKDYRGVPEIVDKVLKQKFGNFFVLINVYQYRLQSYYL